MTINKVDLQKALERVKPGLANRELIEQSTSFAFMGDRVVTYNDEISISHPVNGMDVTGAVKAESLYALLSKIKRDEIEMEWEENQVKIKAGRARAGLVFEQELRLPVGEVGKIGDWKKLPGDVMTAMKFCYPICSKDMSRPVLTCIHVGKKAVRASDSYQIVKHALQEEMPVNEFLIPASSVRELIKYDVTEIAEGEGWYHFKTEDGTVFSSRVFDGDFPEIDALLEFDGTEISFPKTSGQALDKAKIFSKGDFHADHLAVVDVKVGDNRITFSSKNESGWFEESVRTRYKEKEITFTTGIEFLMEVLRQSPTCVFSEDRIKFTGENWKHIVAITTEGEGE